MRRQNKYKGTSAEGSRKRTEGRVGESLSGTGGPARQNLFEKSTSQKSHSAETVAHCRIHPIPYLYTLRQTIAYAYTLPNAIAYLNICIPYLNTCITCPNTLTWLSAPYLNTCTTYINTLSLLPILIHALPILIH